MTSRKTLALGGALGLVPPVIVLALLWRYGLFEIMLGSIDLRTVLWPSSVMLTTGWCCTVPGVLITISSLGINCVLYMVVALLVRAATRSLRSRRTSGS